MIEELLKKIANDSFDNEDDNESILSTSCSRNRRQNIGICLRNYNYFEIFLTGQLNNSVRSQRTSLDSSTNSSRRPSTGDLTSNTETNAQFGQVYYRQMCVYVLRLADAISKHIVKYEILKLFPY